MRKKEKSITEKIDLDSIQAEIKPIVNSKEILNHPATKIVITGIAVYGILHLSKHFINAYAGLRKAIRNAKESTK